MAKIKDQKPKTVRAPRATKKELELLGEQGRATRRR